MAHPFWTVFVLALVVRWINIMLLSGDSAFFAEADAWGYWALGSELARADTFRSTLWSMTDRMPLYPLLIAGVKSIFGEAPRAVAMVQAIIDAATCTLIAAIGALLSPRVGLFAGILAALSVTLVVFSSQILTESLFLFWFALMLLLGARFLLHPTNGLALAGGLAGGLSLMTRPTVALLLIAAIPVVFAVALGRRRRVVSGFVAACLFAIGAVAPVAPLWLRNIIHYGSFSWTSVTGDHLAFWIVPLVIQRADGTPYQVTVDRMERLYRQRLDERGLGAETNPFRRNALKTELAREEMARLPISAFAKAWLEGMIVNLGAPALLEDPRVRSLPKPSFYNTPGTTLWERTRAYLFGHPGLYQVMLLGGLIAMIPFLGLEAIGFVMLARTYPWAAVLAGGVIAYFLLLNGPVGSAKYRLPMEPALIVLAAMPLAWLSARGRSQVVFAATERADERRT
jgi:Dolichyl-phosphate-mannose-protein mannosyltransferase